MTDNIVIGGQSIAEFYKKISQATNSHQLEFHQPLKPALKLSEALNHPARNLFFV